MFYLIKILIFILNLLPYVLVRQLGRFGGYSSSFLLRRDFQIATAQINLVRSANKVCTDNNKLFNNTISSTALARECFTSAGELAAELLCLDKLHNRVQEDVLDLTVTPAKKYNTAEELTKPYLESQKMVVALSAHIGCFELLAAYYARRNKIYAAAKKPNYLWLDKLLTEFREKNNIHTLWRDDNNSQRALIKAVKSYSVFAALIDQDTKLDNIYQPFLGIPAAIPKAPLTIAIRYKLPVFCSFIIRQPKGKQLIICRQITKGTEDNIDETYLAAKFNQIFESIIAKYPEQWVWWHRRWRRRPEADYAIEPDKLPSYSRYLAWLDKETSSAK